MLKRFLLWIWCPGPCKLKIIKQTDVYVTLDNAPVADDQLPEYTKYVSQCEGCGKLKFEQF